MSKNSHQIHIAIADQIQNSLQVGYELIRDMACGGQQRIPLFRSINKSRDNAYCDVDLLVLKNNEIRAIVEIEESNVKPTQICGKFLTSALCRYYIHRSKRNKPLEMHDPVTFIQVVDTSGLVKDKTAKYRQWDNLEESIMSMIPVKDSRIGKYRLLYDEKLSEISSILKES